MSVTCDPHGCCMLNGVPVVCDSQSDHVLTAGWRGGGARGGGRGRRGGEGANGRVSVDHRLGEVSEWV